MTGGETLPGPVAAALATSRFGNKTKRFVSFFVI
jgi:hypothetical protein